MNNASLALLHWGVWRFNLRGVMFGTWKCDMFMFFIFFTSCYIRWVHTCGTFFRDKVSDTLNIRLVSVVGYVLFSLDYVTLVFFLSLDHQLINLQYPVKAPHESLTMSLQFLLIMFVGECSLNLFHCFHSCSLVNAVLNFFRGDIMSPTTEEDTLWLIPLPLTHHCLGSIPTHGTSHLVLTRTITHGDTLINCRGARGLCSPLGLMPHSFPLVEALEFRVFSPILYFSFAISRIMTIDLIE
jgi:hypothetical protein